MHHDEGAVTPFRLVELVGEAEIEGAVPAAVRIELLCRDRVEALGRLAVAFLELGSKPSRPQAYGVGGEAHEAPVLLHPKLELRLELEQAEHHRIAELHPLRRQSLIEMGEIGRAGERLTRAVARLMLGAHGVDAHAVERLPPLRCEREQHGTDQNSEDEERQEFPHSLPEVSGPKSAIVSQNEPLWFQISDF